MILDMKAWEEMGKPDVHVMCDGVRVRLPFYADTERGIVRYMYPLRNKDGIIEEHLFCESEGDITIFIDGKMVSQ